MLCQAKRAPEDPHNRRILYSTNAIVFFGTPHRGSPRHAILAESARRLASNILRCDSNRSILNLLGDNSPELDETHKEFLEVKNCYGIRVKSFQEAFGLTSINAFGLNSKVRGHRITQHRFFHMILFPTNVEYNLLGCTGLIFNNWGGR
jgi:hypothetical protein